MAKTYEAAVKLVARIPTEKTTQYFFRSLLASLCKEDQVKVVDDLLDYVTAKEDVQKCA